MNESTAKELEWHRVRIEGIRTLPKGRYIMITDLETDKQIENVTRIEFAPIVPSEVIMVRLTLLHIGKMEEQPDGGREAPVSEETVTVKCPELDLTAYVEEAKEVAG